MNMLSKRFLGDSLISLVKLNENICPKLEETP